MGNQIHSTAIIDPKAVLGDDVVIGAYAMVGADVTLGNGCEVMPHAIVEGPSVWGKNNIIHPFARVGAATSDMKYRGEYTTLTVGDNNIIREGVTLHRGTIQDRSDTTIGSNNLFLPYVHVGHDCIVGDHCVFVNNVGLAGHVRVRDWVTIGGYSGVNQHSILGAHCFITGMVRIKRDVPAFIIVGSNAQPVGINREGLKRRGFDAQSIKLLSNAYKVLYRQNLVFEDAIVEVSKMAEQHPCIKPLLDSLKESKRGIIR